MKVELCLHVGAGDDEDASPAELGGAGSMQVPSDDPAHLLMGSDDLAECDPIGIGGKPRMHRVDDCSVLAAEDHPAYANGWR
jgi:hypothetical protein